MLQDALELSPEAHQQTKLLFGSYSSRLDHIRRADALCVANVPLFCFSATAQTTSALAEGADVYRSLIQQHQTQGLSKVQSTSLIQSFEDEACLSTHLILQFWLRVLSLAQVGVMFAHSHPFCPHTPAICEYIAKEAA